MILWLSAVGAVVLVGGAAIWMVQRSLDRTARGIRQVERDASAEDQFGL